MKRLVVFSALSGAFAAGAVNVDDLGRGPGYRLYFPPFKRIEAGAGSGRVAAIKVVVRCGYFTGVARIPGDWWLEMRGPVSGESTLVASAGHGASYLWRLETWNGSIAITPYDTSCFDVEASVVVDGPDDAKGNELKYTRRQLRLVP